MSRHSRLLSAILACVFCFPLASHAFDLAPGCKYAESGRLALSYTGPNLEITTMGRINGREALVMVDTANDMTALTSTGIARHGLKTRQTRRRISGVGGSSGIHETNIDEFSVGIGGSVRGAVPVFASLGYAPNYDAILGAPFLYHADLELFLTKKEFKLFRPSQCRDAFLAYWNPEASVIPLEPRPETDVPHFLVEVNGIKMLATVDSGAASSAMTLKAAMRAGVNIDERRAARTNDAVGIGGRKARRWSTRFDTVVIGRETIRNAEIGVIDYESKTDLLLGADFLRSHRILVAMSQRKVYITYEGGEPFSQRRSLEPWIIDEANNGNADAQMALAHTYSSSRSPHADRAKGEFWLEKAARSGHPRANIVSGRRLMLSGSLEEGIVRLRYGLERLPTERLAPLWLYIAEVRAGRTAEAKAELLTFLPRYNEKEWPYPIAQFYIGQISSADLLEKAGNGSRANTCQALGAITEWVAAHGHSESARPPVSPDQQKCVVPLKDPSVEEAPITS